jgi:hypothetical protein
MVKKGESMWVYAKDYGLVPERVFASLEHRYPPEGRGWTVFKPGILAAPHMYIEHAAGSTERMLALGQSAAVPLAAVAPAAIAGPATLSNASDGPPVDMVEGLWTKHARMAEKRTAKRGDVNEAATGGPMATEPPSLQAIPILRNSVAAQAQAAASQVSFGRVQQSIPSTSRRIHRLRFPTLTFTLTLCCL